jgi:hypothetical protein
MAKQRVRRDDPIESPIAPAFEAYEVFEVQPVQDGLVRVVFTHWFHSPRTDTHERRIAAYMLAHIASLRGMIRVLEQEIAKHAAKRGRSPGSKRPGRKRLGRPPKNGRRRRG